MPRIRSALPEGSVSIEQIVSYNFQRAREERGWTQVEVSDRLIPLLGYELRQAGVSTIETCGRGNRRRAFAANELLAFAQCFDLPLGWWFIPPPEWAGRPCDPSNLRLLDVVDDATIPGCCSRRCFRCALGFYSRARRWREWWMVSGAQSKQTVEQ